MFSVLALGSCCVVAPVAAASPRANRVSPRTTRVGTKSRVRCVKTRASTITPTPPALSNPEMGTRAKDFTKRKVTVPYKDEPVDCEIMVNDGARAAIKANDAERFVSLIDPKNPKLEKLLRVMEAGWDKVGVRAKNAGHHTLWPEAFEAGACLLREAFPEECDPEFGGEVLSGVAFVGDDKKDRAIDFMQRRPKTDFTMSKYNPLGRLHRDPDAIDYKSPGWMETSMPDSIGEGDDNGYSYRYYNLWLARTPIDPTGETWESPLCLLLPKHGGAQEWRYDVRFPEDNDTAVPETTQEMMARMMKNPLSAAPIIMSAFSTTKKSKEEQFAFTDQNYMKRGSPELERDATHVWITHPFVIFDSFDMWHGAGKWDSEEKADIIDKCVDKTRARQDASKGRVSMELRFRARCKPNQKNGVPFSPVSSAYRGKVFTPDTVRPSEGRYDLVTGTVAVK